MAAAPTSCATPAPTGGTVKPATPTATRWVVLSGPSYSRGPNEHFVTCVREDLGEDGPWREILITPGQAYDPAQDNPATNPFEPGKPCPQGPERK
jgi:hypothetical protein